MLKKEATLAWLLDQHNVFGHVVLAVSIYKHGAHSAIHSANDSTVTRIHGCCSSGNPEIAR